MENTELLSSTSAKARLYSVFSSKEKSVRINGREKLESVERI